MAAEPDRLSALPDDLLRRILGLAPAREAASTAVLSRRWRGVWPTAPSPAVILDIRLYDRTRGGDSHISDRREIDRDAFFHDAEAALAAHGFSGGIRSLAVHVEANGPEAIQSFMSQYHYHREPHYIAGDVLGHPACRHVEVLTVEGVPSYLSAATTTARRRAASRRHEQSAVAQEHDGYYKLSLGSVPSAALRVHRIAGCKDLTHPLPAPPATGAAAFPWLESVRLHHCAVSIFTLQDMIAASPCLGDLRLESVYLKSKVSRPSTDPNGAVYGAHYGYGLYNNNSYYNNGDNDCSGLVLPGRDLARGSKLRVQEEPQDRRAEGAEVQNFSNAKFLKLKLNFAISEIAAVIEGKKKQEELLAETLFSNLEGLEVDGQYIPGSEAAVGAAIGNLLRCCPVLRDLKLKLNTVDRNFRKTGRRSDWSDRLYKSTFLERKSKMDTRKSAKHFAQRRYLEFISLGERDGDDDYQCEVSDIPGLSDKWFEFSCLRDHLTRARLQFRMDKHSSSFGMQLVKFFLERATVLEEMYIDDGNRKMCEL
ncbi:unnamed protein product [Urochloa decumbens]|uniref:F-box domain-containing protein n=1 Tax=Urochloa decumbens TaxID=240449 RepID=A0ABC9B1S5_9POAL